MVRGLRGKKIETFSVPYSAINMWSTENAGTLDINAEIELWTRSGWPRSTWGVTSTSWPWTS